MRAAQADAKKEIDEYKAQREAKLRTVQPEVRRFFLARIPCFVHLTACTTLPLQAQALAQRVSRATRETDMKIAALE